MWKPLRTSLLRFTLGGVVLVLGKSLFFPYSATPNVNHFDLPSTIPLSNWQPLTSRPIQNELIANQGREYQFQKGKLPLNIQTFYVTHPHNNEKLFRKYDPNQIQQPIGLNKPEIYYEKKIGFYSLVVRDNKVHLNACISQRGGSVITYQQFIQHRYTSDLQLNRLVPWLLGQQPLRDHRCIWNHLSIPLNETSLEQRHLLIQKAWLSWYQWWQDNYPSY